MHKHTSEGSAVASNVPSDISEQARLNDLKMIQFHGDHKVL